MNEKQTGGTAFPFSDLTKGMSLRDYFAAKAMQSFVQLDHMGSGVLAKEAYEIADAMIKERTK